MQACRLSLAEVTHPSKVVKVWLDQSTESLALMLSDSSCLLYSLKFPSIAVNVPGPVTDGCFLRLLQKKSQKQQRPLVRGRSASCDRVENAKGAKKEEGDAGLLFFLVAMPGRGGSRTSIRAYVRPNQGFPRSLEGAPGNLERTLGSLDGVRFSRALVEVKDKNGKDGVSEGLGKKAAGVLDLPHGFSVKIAASVNVFVVYSVAAGKIWVMAAKARENVDEFGKLAGVGAKSEGFKRANGIAFNGDNLVCISLIKCCVVDCSGPIYSIRLSLQHMVLGEENGVRVWPLRPLVKGRSKKHARERIKLGDKGKEENSLRNGLKIGGLDQGNLQMIFAENGRKIRALDQGNYLENNLQWNFLENGKKIRASDQGNSMENNLQPNSVENGRKVGAFGRVDSLENGREETGLLKTVNQLGEGGEMVLGNFSKEGNFQNVDRETITSNGSEVVIGNVVRGVRAAEACEKRTGRLVSLDLDKKNLLEKLDIGEKAGLTLGKPPRNGVIDNAIEGCKDVSGIYCNGAKMDAEFGASLNQGMLALDGKGSVDTVVNLVNGVRCNCVNLPNGSIETGSEVGNLVNSTLRECETKSLVWKRMNGQLCPNRAALDDLYIQQLSQQSSSSAASSSLSGSLALPSVSMSASALSSCVLPSVSGSTHSVEGTIHAPMSSLLVKSRSALKMKDTSGKACSFFVPFEDARKEGDKVLRLRATAVHALSQTKFVVLDSAGDMHILSLHNPISIGEGQKEHDRVIAGHCCLSHLKCSMKVNMLAAFPETSSSTSQSLWVSDGHHSIHLLTFPDVNASSGEDDKDPEDENLLKLSVMQAVFLSDRVRAIAAMSANATLVFTQGSINAYSIAGS